MKPRILQRTVFGNPILREPTQPLDQAEILSDEIQNLIRDMRHTLEVKKYGIGLAAPQVGRGIALSVIWIKPTPTRPNLSEKQMVVINPEIIKMSGQKVPKWEGCISFGSGSDFPYAQALRWNEVRIRYLDETGRKHERKFTGMLAHVLQHEVDHLNGVLFVDRVVDPASYVMISEYKKRILPREQKRS